MADSFGPNSQRRITRVVLDAEKRRRDLVPGRRPRDTPIPFQFRRFELATPFTLVGNATYATADAYFLSEKGDIEGPTFVVTDVFGTLFGIPNGAYSTPYHRGSQGTCYHPHDVDRWEVVDFADAVIWFELKTNLPSSGTVIAGQSATAFFVKPNGVVDTTTEFTVFDELGVYRGRAKDKFTTPNNQGSRGRAKLDVDKGRLYIVEMTPHVLRISGVTGSAVLPTTTQFTLSGTPELMNPSGSLFMVDLTTANLIKNPLKLSFASGETIHAEWNEGATTPQWEVVVPSKTRLLWAIAQSDWDDNSDDPKVSVKSCSDRDGTSPTGDAFDVYLPRTIDADPAIYDGGVIGYAIGSDGDPVCITPYMNGKVGDIRQIVALETPLEYSGIPEGWEELAAANHRALIGRDVEGESDEGTPGAQLGFRWHGEYEIGDSAKNNHPDHPHHQHSPGSVTNTIDGIAGSSVNEEPPDESATFDTDAAAGHVHSVTISMARTEVWFEDPSGPDEAIPPASGDLHNHTGPFKGLLTTDNRGPRLVVITIHRIK